MKKTMSFTLALVMLLGVFAAAPISADAALTNTQINIYKAELNSIHSRPLSYVSLFNDNKKEIENCTFTIVDVNDDGTDDLVVKFDRTYMAAMHSIVYTVKNNKIKRLGEIGVFLDFYKNGYFTSKAYHNQGPGNKIWPYSIGRFNSSSQSFEYFSSVYSAEEDHPRANITNGYRYYLDYDNDGVIYYVDGQPYTKAQYDNYVNTYIPAKNKKTVNWLKITTANISNLGKPASVKLNRNTLGLGVGEDYGLLKTVSPSFANQSVSWSSSNSSIATVDKNGKVVGKKSGKATVTVKTSNGKTASCTVTVKSAPSSVKTNPASLKLGIGESYTVSECTNSGSYANAANLRWTSSNTSAATVVKTAGTNKAVVTAKSKGSANISIKTYNGKTASCALTVYPAPSSVKLSATNITLKKGQTYTISESSPSGTYANSANLKWTSSNTKIATVTKGSANKATIKALSSGTSTIRISLFNGKTATCKVTVK